MRILILGAGAIGGYLGARLIEAGAEVTFLVRPPRAATIAREGLRLVSPLGDAVIRPKVVTRAVREFDLIVLACKGTDLGQVLDAIEPAAGETTVILPFLNGIAHLPRIAWRFPHAILWGGVANIGVTLEPDGTVHHLGTDNRFWFGPVSGQPSRLGRDLQVLLAKTPVQSQLRRDIVGDLWAKFVAIGALAGVTTLTRTSMETVLATPTGAETMRALFSECRAIAIAEYPATDDDALTEYEDYLTDPGCRSGSSMLRDLLAGRPTEHEHIHGDLLARARLHGLSVPLLTACYTHLTAQALLRATPKGT